MRRGYTWRNGCPIIGILGNTNKTKIVRDILHGFSERIDFLALMRDGSYDDHQIDPTDIVPDIFIHDKYDEKVLQNISKRKKLDNHVDVLIIDSLYIPEFDFTDVMVIICVKYISQLPTNVDKIIFTSIDYDYIGERYKIHLTPDEGYYIIVDGENRYLEYAIENKNRFGCEKMWQLQWRYGNDSLSYQKGSSP